MRALKIIFAIVASLIALDLVSWVCSVCYYNFLWDSEAYDAFEAQRFAIIIFGIISFVTGFLTYGLTAIGFFIWFGKSKPGMKVKGGAMILAIGAILSLVLSLLQFFGLTVLEREDTWSHDPVNMGYLGWLAIGIINLIGIILLMRSVKGRGFMKTVAIAYPALLITNTMLNSIRALYWVYGIEAFDWDWNAGSEMFYIINVGLSFFASLCRTIFYAIYASTFKAQPALVQGSGPIQSAEPTMLATPATPAVPTTQQRLDELQRQIDELQRLKAQQEANNNPQSNE
ncbi:MAG: hypothetical protein J6B41_04545 [Alistipes sp.]|nr:hypothetical protein [Alistipes sp.]